MVSLIDKSLIISGEPFTIALYFFIWKFFTITLILYNLELKSNRFIIPMQ